MARYKIVRMHLHARNQVIERGLTLEEAQAHCQDPETSSSTARKATLGRVGKGQWFDGYSSDTAFLRHANNQETDP